MAKTPKVDSDSDVPANIGTPAKRALAGAGYTSMSELSKMSEAEVLKLHGMGPKAIGIIRVAMADKGMTFATPGN